MKAVIFIITAIVSYLIGSLNFAIIVSHDLDKDDVRKHGSKNAGLTNVLRTYGKHEAFLTFLGDFLKGIFTTALTKIVFSVLGFSDIAHTAMYFSMLFTVMGHSYPIYFKFKGGKGILTSAACLLVIDWRIFLIIISVFAGLVLITRIVSLASIAAAITAGITATYFGFTGSEKHPVINTILIIAIVIFVIIKHRENIKRLINGTENKLSFGKKKQG